MTNLKANGYLRPITNERDNFKAGGYLQPKQKSNNILSILTCLVVLSACSILTAKPNNSVEAAEPTFQFTVVGDENGKIERSLPDSF